MKFTEYNNTLISIIIFNIVNLVITLAYNQGLVFLLFLFIIEGIIIWIFTILKLFLMKEEKTVNQAKKAAEKIIKAVLFSIGFLLFLFIFIFFTNNAIPDLFPNLSISKTTFISICLLALFSHGLSLIFNFYKKKEYLTATQTGIMTKGFERIVYLFLYSFIVGMFSIPLSSDYNYYSFELYLVIVFFAIKIFFDIIFHVKEHTLYLHPDFGYQWNSLMEKEKERLGVNILTTEQMMELYKKIEKMRYN
jgi:hypothetical protein